MNTIDTIKQFSPLETLRETWRYCLENRHPFLIFTLVNSLFFILGFKVLGGMKSLLFVFWCMLYYLFSCYFFRFYYHRKPYLLTRKIFDSLIPSTKILFITLLLITLLSYLPFLPLFLGLPIDVLDDYTTGFIQEYMGEKRIYDWGVSLVVLLASPLIFYRPLMAWVSSAIGRSGSLQNAWRRTKGNYGRFLLINVVWALASWCVSFLDVFCRADDWISLILGSPLVIFCNVYVAKTYDFFFLQGESA